MFLCIVEGSSWQLAVKEVDIDPNFSNETKTVAIYLNMMYNYALCIYAYGRLSFSFTQHACSTTKYMYIMISILPCIIVYVY